MEEVVRRVRIDVTSNANQANRGLENLRNTLHGLSGRYSAASRGANSHSSALKAVAKATNIATNQNKKYMSTLKRVVMYRAIRYAMKAIIDGFKQGLENAYFFSKGINGDLAQALDLMAVKSQTMKNQLGAAFGSLLQTIQPIILTIISLVTKLAEAITMLFSLLGGKGTYLKAVDASAAFKKNTAGGAAAAKKMKDYLMGIDELNVIKKPDDTGGGGGGGNSASWSSMFEETELPEWAGNLKDLIDLGEFREAGAFLAEHLNGIIDEWDAEAAGRALGEKIGHAVSFAFGFLYGGENTTGFDFENLGKKLQTALNAIAKEIDPEELGGILVGKIHAIVGLLKGALEAYDPEATGKWLGEVINGAIKKIPWEDAGTVIHDGFIKALKTGASLLEGLSLTELGMDVGKFFASLLGLEGGDANSIVQSFKSIGESLDKVKESIVGIMTAITEWKPNTSDMENFKKSVQDLASAVNRLLEDISKMLNNFKSDVPTVLDAALATLTACLEIVSATVDGVGLIADGIALLGYAAGGVWYGLKGQWDEYKTAVSKDVDATLASAKGHAEGIGESIKTAWSAVMNKDSGNRIGNEFGAGVAEGMANQTNMTTLMTEDEYRKMHGRIKSYADGTNDYIRYVAEQTGQDVDIVKKSFSDAVENSNELGEVSADVAAGIKLAIQNAILEAGGDFAAGIKEIENVLYETQKNITNGVKTMMVDASAAILAGFALIQQQASVLFGSFDIWIAALKGTIILFASDTTTTLFELETYIINTGTRLREAYDALIDHINFEMNALRENFEIEYCPEILKLITSTMNSILVAYYVMSGLIHTDLTDKLGNVREEIILLTGTFKANMMDAAGTARQEIAAIREALDKLNGYTVHVYIVVHEVGSGGSKVLSRAKDSFEEVKAKFGITAHGGIIKAANGMALPNRGQLFIAREAGAELVGDIGNGRTAVMNNNQIVQSVSDGVYSAVMSAMSQQSNTDDRPIVLQIDGREIARAVRQGERQTGYQLSSNPTFA